jgi:hypothetical protein
LPSVGKFHSEPPFTSLDYPVGARERRRRHFEPERERHAAAAQPNSVMNSRRFN